MSPFLRGKEGWCSHRETIENKEFLDAQAEEAIPALFVSSGHQFRPIRIHLCLRRFQASEPSVPPRGTCALNRRQQAHCTEYPSTERRLRVSPFNTSPHRDHPSRPDGAEDHRRGLSSPDPRTQLLSDKISWSRRHSLRLGRLV